MEKSVYQLGQQLALEVINTVKNSNVQSALLAEIAKTLKLNSSSAFEVVKRTASTMKIEELYEMFSASKNVSRILVGELGMLAWEERRKGVTVYEIAKRCGVTTSTVYRWCRNAPGDLTA